MDFDMYTLEVLTRHGWRYIRSNFENLRVAIAAFKEKASEYLEFKYRVVKWNAVVFTIGPLGSKVNWREGF